MMLSRRNMRAPIILYLVVALIAQATSAAEMSLGAIIMQLRSTVDATNTTQLNQKVGDATTQYLNEYFGAYYTRTEQMPKDYFSDIFLSMKSFGVHGASGSFITTIEIGGTLSFNSDLLPSSFFIETLLRNAFKGRNERLYLDQLLKLEDDFLQNLTYLIIDINQSNVAESTIDEDGASSTEISSSANEEHGENAKRSSSEKWIATVIGVTSMIIALMVFFLSYVLHLWCKKRREETEEEKSSNDDAEPMKVIKLPVKKQQKSPSLSITTKDSKIIGKLGISPTSTASTSRSSPHSIAAKMDRPPPSPQRSMTSQESSMFTYTDNMSRFTIGNTVNHSRFKLPGSPFSKFSLLDVPSIDLSMWRGGRQGRQDPPAFQSDISVIEKRHDLSMIPEQRVDLESGLRNNNTNNYRRNYYSKKHLSRKSRVALDARHSHSRYSNRSETYFYGGRNDDNDSDGGLEMSADDVIGDLKNLSMQIERQRQNARAKRESHR